MFVGRRECIIAIDGDYVHIMPPEHKGMFDSVKTVKAQRLEQDKKLLADVSPHCIDFLPCQRCGVM